MQPLPQPKKRALHGYQYSPKEQAEKDMVIKQMIRDFPNTPGGELWCEYVYDFCHNTPQDEIDRIIQSGEWDRPSKHSTEATRKMIAEHQKDGAPPDIES